MRDPVLATDLVEQHLTVAGLVPPEPVGELTTVVSDHLGRYRLPRRAHRDGVDPVENG